MGLKQLIKVIHMNDKQIMRGSTVHEDDYSKCGGMWQADTGDEHDRAMDTNSPHLQLIKVLDRCYCYGCLPAGKLHDRRLSRH